MALVSPIHAEQNTSATTNQSDVLPLSQNPAQWAARRDYTWGKIAAPLEAKALSGDLDALLKWSALRLDRPWIETNNPQLRALLLKAAEAGNAEAMYLAGHFKIPCGDESAELWLQRAADAGHPAASYDFVAARMNRPREEYIRRLAQGAKAGLAESQQALGGMLCMGVKNMPVTPESFAEGLRLIEASLAQSIPGSAAESHRRHLLGAILQNAAKTPEDHARAAGHLMRAFELGAPCAARCAYALRAMGGEANARQGVAVLAEDLAIDLDHTDPTPVFYEIPAQASPQMPTLYADRFFAATEPKDRWLIFTLRDMPTTLKNFRQFYPAVESANPAATSLMIKKLGELSYAPSDKDTAVMIRAEAMDVLEKAADSGSIAALDELLILKRQSTNTDTVLASKAKGSRVAVRMARTLLEFTGPACLCPRKYFLEQEFISPNAFPAQEPQTFAEVSPAFAILDRLAGQPDWRKQLNDAAATGDADARFTVATILFHESGEKSDRAKAKEVFEKLASKNHREAVYALAQLEPDRDNRLGLYESAAKLGHIRAGYEAAMLCGRGPDSSRESRRHAVELIRPAVEIGMPAAIEAMYPLVADSRDTPFSDERPALAKKWHDAGVAISRERTRQSDEKNRGITDKDRAAALDSLGELAGKGNAIAGVLAANAMMNLRSNSPEKTTAARYRLYRRAADAGVPEAMLFLAEIHNTPRSEFSSTREAAKWRDMASKSGSPDADYAEAKSRWESATRGGRNADSATVQFACRKLESALKGGVSQAEQPLAALLAIHAPGTPAGIAMPPTKTGKDAVPSDHDAYLAFYLAWKNKRATEALDHLITYWRIKHRDSGWGPLPNPLENVPDSFGGASNRVQTTEACIGILQSLAEAGSPDACLALAQILAEKTRAPYDALPWYRRALALKHPYAGFEMGVFLFDYGRNAEEWTEGESLVRTAAAAGDPFAVQWVSVTPVKRPVRNYAELRDAALNGESFALAEMIRIHTQNPLCARYRAAPEITPDMFEADAWAEYCITLNKGGIPNIIDRNTYFGATGLPFCERHHRHAERSKTRLLEAAKGRRKNPPVRD